MLRAWHAICIGSRRRNEIDPATTEEHRLSLGASARGSTPCWLSSTRLYDAMKGVSHSGNSETSNPIEGIAMKTPDTKTNNSESRRDFLRQSGCVAAASALAGVSVPRSHAAGDSTVKLALVGCGGRGTGAAGPSAR